MLSMLFFFAVVVPMLQPRQAALVNVPMKKISPVEIITPRALSIARPDPSRLVTNYLTLSWSNSPGARGIIIWFGPNETNDVSLARPAEPWKEVRIDPVSTYRLMTYSGPASNRPPRFFGVIGTIGPGGQVNGDLVPWHWPPYPPIPDGVILTWDTPNPVLIETSTNLVNWEYFAEPLEDFLIVRSETPVEFFRATPLGLVTEPATATITQIYRPDPREL